MQVYVNEKVQDQKRSEEARIAEHQRQLEQERLKKEEADRALKIEKAKQEKAKLEAEEEKAKIEKPISVEGGVIKKKLQKIIGLKLNSTQVKFIDGLFPRGNKIGRAHV